MQLSAGAVSVLIGTTTATASARNHSMPPMPWARSRKNTPVGMSSRGAGEQRRGKKKKHEGSWAERELAEKTQKAEKRRL